ncbi:AsnC family transcriptional regulator [Halomarina oriensis]|uniref:AsnC family transcriptional regulator n=1 Tax=Halomarina oriensis TaxID=671145 RepID=A0A6B0GI23_9EURY|nr:AsnC family transcriptional regulator [Halomarina oriensis]MWG33451.1 AsnC family transcriptional regulator [Halomarina oriensis]
MPTKRDSNAIDEIDRRILSILAHDPRTPYSNISTQLAEEGIEMSSEGVRRRVTALLDITTTFHLLRPDGQDWEIFVITVQVAHESGAKEAVFEAMSEMSFWFVGSGFGTIDLYAIATVDSNREIDDLVNRVRSLEQVTAAEYMIETDRSVNVERYLQIAEE